MLARQLKIKDYDDDGFQSEHDSKQQIQPAIDQLDLLEPPQQKSIKQQLSPPKQIKIKSYSLYPDILTGWCPKKKMSESIPLVFDNNYLDMAIRLFQKQKHQNANIKLCYLGPRYDSTYFAWYDKQFQFPYKHLCLPRVLKFTNRTFCGQHWKAQSKDDLHFNSFFESGNLDAAFLINQFQYELFMRVDSNTRGHLQWFNFKVKNMKKKCKYKFNISNFQKGNILYIRQSKPFIYSQRKYEQTGKKWQQLGQQLQYSKKVYKIDKYADNQQLKGYRLKFIYQCQYQNDQIQIAYCVPYTYSNLLQFIEKIQAESEGENILKVTSLTNSLGGLNIPLITITNPTPQNIFNPIQRKKIIIASGRMHPGQSNGSHTIEGFISFLCGKSRQAHFLRQRIIFKIVPMMNPDGVILGNYRTGISGRDFNREFINPDADIFPEVYAFKQMVGNLKKVYGQKLIMFLDFHGHSVKKNIFVYGPEYPLINRNYYECRILPKLISLKCEMFRYYSCSFKVSQFKQSTARAVLLKNYNIPFTFTIEASNGSYFIRDQMKDCPFDDQKWILFGQQLGQALKDYIQMIQQAEKVRLEKLKQRKKNLYKKQKQKNQKAAIKYKNIKNQKYFLRTCNGNSFKSQNFRQSSELQITGHLYGRQSNQNQQNHFQLMIDEITKENELKQKFHNEQDQISQGSSDKEGSDNDLDQEQMDNLILKIKNPKLNINNLNIQIKKRKTRVNTQVQIPKLIDRKGTQILKTPFSGYDGDDQYKGNYKQSSPKRYTFLKKKSLYSEASSPLRKQQKAQLAAKIVNFSFGLKAVENQQTQLINLIELKDKKTYNNTRFYNQQIPNDNRRITLFKNGNFPDTFKRTFLSLQKQTAKREDNNKTKPINSLTYSSGQYLKGKKIKINS